MEFIITIRFKGENEAEMVQFLTFIKDNYPSEVTHGSADSGSFNCHATITFPSLEGSISAVQAFKQQFTISYKLEITP